MPDIAGICTSTRAMSAGKRAPARGPVPHQQPRPRPDAVLGVEQGAEAGAHQHLVVDERDPDHGASSGSPSGSSARTEKPPCVRGAACRVAEAVNAFAHPGEADAGGGRRDR